MFDGIEKLGTLTPNDRVTETFLSFLGDSTETGEVPKLCSSTVTTNVESARPDQRGFGGRCPESSSARTDQLAGNQEQRALSWDFPNCIRPTN